MKKVGAGVLLIGCLALFYGPRSFVSEIITEQKETPVDQNNSSDDPEELPTPSPAEQPKETAPSSLKLHRTGVQESKEASNETLQQEEYEDEIERVPDFVIEAEGDYDIRQKQHQVKELVEKGVKYLEEHSFDKAFNVFSHSDEFRMGELYLFVYTNSGVVVAHGGGQDMMWKDQWNEQDDYGVYLVREIVKTAQQRGARGGWVNYFWRGASKRSFIRQVVKGERTFAIGSGYYPHSKADAVINLVQGAATYFNDVVHKEGRSVDDAFSTFNYPMGRFVQGDLYLYVIAFDGMVMAHGERPGLVGTNGLEFQDANGVYVNKEIIKKLKESTGSVWQKYISKNAQKIAYAKKVVDQHDKHYFIACGYYPDANRNEVIELVKRGYQFFKRHGRDVAAKEFNDKRVNRFRYGDLALMVHDFKGGIVADGTNPDLVGMPAWDFQDQDGRYIVRELIARAKDGGGWLNFKVNNAFKLVYVEEIQIGTKQYAISSGLYPISKEETMWLMVKSAVSTLNAESLEYALRKFVKGESGYLRGDLWIYVIDTSGIVLAWGTDYTSIWKNFMNKKDGLGKPYIRMLINGVRQGPTTVTYVEDEMKRLAYAEEVEKEGRRYVVGSAYYF